MRILVTGAAGFVGANLVRGWVDAGHDVVAVVSTTSRTWRLTDVSCAVEFADLEDPSAIDSLFRGERPSVVVNSAAHGAYSSQHNLARMLAVNVHAVERLTSNCHRLNIPFLHFGSSSEYGELDHPPSEVERLSPNSHYAITKAAGTHVACEAIRRGLVGAVFRLYSVYGPWEEPSRLMPTLARHAINGTLPPLVSPSVARDFVHVNDVLVAATTWIERPISIGLPPIVNIGSGQQTTIEQLVDTVRGLYPEIEQPHWGTMSNRDWDVTCWVSDSTKARTFLDWRARVPLVAGFADLVSFVRSHPERYGP